MITFAKMVAQTKPHLEKPNRLLAFDPGGTTGWAFFENQRLSRAGVLPNCYQGVYRKIVKLFDIFNPDFVVIEDYVVYANKVDQHVNSPLFVPKLIGRIEQECDARKIPYHMQLASEGKGFMTDKKMKAWKMMPDNGHAADAVRHGGHYLIFG